MKKQLFSAIVAMFVAASTHAAPTIVLVHGALLTSTVWAPVQSQLQNAGYNVVTVDTPGRMHEI